MKVSAVITAFNRREYIVRAIDSVLQQTVPVDEILVIDDGSTDGTADVVEHRYGDAVRIVRQPNRGPGGARHRGICEARGDWIAFLDSDDEWTPNRNRELLQASERVPANVAWIFGDLQIMADGKTASFFEQHGFALEESPQVISDPLRFQYPTLFSYLQASLIRRDALRELNCFKEGFRSEDDVLAAIQIGCRYSFAAIRSTVVKYYRTADLASSSVAIHGARRPDAYRARMIALATVMNTRRKRSWGSEYASAVRELCKAVEEDHLPPTTLAFEQFRYGGFSFRSIAFMCFAFAGWRGVRFWSAVAALWKRILLRLLPNRPHNSRGHFEGIAEKQL